MMFPGRAPDNLYLYTTFVGGSRNKELAKASKYALTAFSLFNSVVYPHFSFNYYFFIFGYICTFQVTSVFLCYIIWV